MPPVEGVVDFVRDRDDAEPEDARAKLTGFGLTLPDGSFILVAQDAEPPDRHAARHRAGLRLGGRA